MRDTTLSRRLLVASLGAGLLATATVAPASATAAAPAADDVPAGSLMIDLPAPPSPERLRELRVATRDARAEGPLVRADGEVFRRSSASSVAHYYDDYCGDAGEAPLDLRAAAIVDATAASTAHYGFVVETCKPITASQLASGVTLQLVTDEDRPQDRRRFEIFLSAIGKTVVGAVHDLDSSDDEPTFLGTGQLAPDGHGAGFAFPATAIAGVDSFFFVITSFGPDDAAVDRMPEYDDAVMPDGEIDIPEDGVPPEPPGYFPDGSCQVDSVARQTVTAASGRLAESLAAVRTAGLTPTSVHEASGTFEVLLASPDHVDAVRRLAGVVDVRSSQVFTRAATDPVATAAQANAWWRTQVRASAASGRASGAGVTIAVIDDGVNGSRSELRNRVAAGFDALRGVAIPAAANSDRGGHGTAVAGVAAARPGEQLTGIAWGATIRPYQVFDFAGCAGASAIAAAIDRAVADGADVINLSLGGPGTTINPLARSLNRARNAGVLVVAAAGNENSNNVAVAPADHSATLAVAATRPDRSRASYSNRAPWVEIAAPGGQRTAEGYTAGNSILTLGARDGYDLFNGTSFSTPIVAGAAALFMEATNSSAEQTRTALGATALDLGAPGRDTAFGHGLLDVRELLRTRPPVRDLRNTCRDAERDAFPDVTNATTVHAAAIDCVAHYQIAGGFVDGSYRPGRKVTRGQMATFIANMIDETGGTLPAPRPTRLTDIAGHAHEANIQRLVTAGIVGGFPDRTFRPNAYVKRDQMARFLAAALEYRTGEDLIEADAGFPDIAGNTHEAFIDKAATAGLAGGDARGRYQPRGDVSREQMGSFLARTVAYLVDTGEASPR
ncbi:S8 family serine peptidase [Egicoccus sp. AB-alg2]|uniref:S8 family peptidase n=1 Tax=Egicoccus sp. AB-alg2 TaxID=3242693 RepID=UPI00359DDBDF